MGAALGEDEHALARLLRSLQLRLPVLRRTVSADIEQLPRGAGAARFPGRDGVACIPGCHARMLTGP